MRKLLCLLGFHELSVVFSAQDGKTVDHPHNPTLVIRSEQSCYACLHCGYEKERVTYYLRLKGYPHA